MVKVRKSTWLKIHNRSATIQHQHFASHARTYSKIYSYTCNKKVHTDRMSDIYKYSWLQIDTTNSHYANLYLHITNAPLNPQCIYWTNFWTNSQRFTTTDIRRYYYRTFFTRKPSVIWQGKLYTIDYMQSAELRKTQHLQRKDCCEGCPWRDSDCLLFSVPSAPGQPRYGGQ